MLLRVLVGVVLLGAALAGWAQPELVPLALRDEQDLARLTAVVTARDVADSLRVDAAKRLALLNAPETINALLAALDDPLPEVRRHAARGLGLIGDPTTATTVAQLLRDPDADVRAAAVAALGWLANPAVLPALEEMLTDTNADARLAAVTALSRMDDPQVAPLLRNVAEDDGKAGAAALLALAQRGDRTITAPCLARAAQPDFNDLTITAALAELGDPAATTTLGKLAEHKNAKLRQIAYVGLARIGDKTALDTLCRVIEGQVATVDRTGEMTISWLPALQMLSPEEATTRFQSWITREQFPLPEAAGRVLAAEYDLPREVLLNAFIGPRVNFFMTRHWLEARQPAVVAPELATSNARFMDVTLAAPRQWRDSEKLDGLLAPTPPPIAFVAPTPQRGCWYMSAELANKLMQGRVTKDGMQGTRIVHLCHTGNHLIGEAVRGFLFEDNEAASVDRYGRGLGVLGDACAVPDLLNIAEGLGGKIPYGILAGLMGCADGRHPASYQVLLDALAAPNKEVRGARKICYPIEEESACGARIIRLE